MGLGNYPVVHVQPASLAFCQISLGVNVLLQQLEIFLEFSIVSTLDRSHTSQLFFARNPHQHISRSMHHEPNPIKLVPSILFQMIASINTRAIDQPTAISLNYEVRQTQGEPEDGSDYPVRYFLSQASCNVKSCIVLEQGISNSIPAKLHAACK